MKQTPNDTTAKTLFDTTSIGKLSMKNRFIRASVGDFAPGGVVNTAMLKRYYHLAKGGVGTIITGYTLVDSAERDMGIMGMYHDSFIESNRRLTDTVHDTGTNILMQLVAIGSNFHSRNRPKTINGASAIENPRTGITPHEMTVEEITSLANKFAEAAVRAQKAGFDGVEIHGSHGYLLHQFASPNLNHRTDKYGGSRENRYRLTIEVYEAIRKAVGDDFPVWIKVQSNDGFEGGVTHADCLYLCEELAKRGIDAIEVSGNFSAYNQDTAYFREIADSIGHATSVPVIVTGGNRNFDDMTNMINETAIDYVGMARPLLSNPNLINDFLKEYKNNKR